MEVFPTVFLPNIAFTAHFLASNNPVIDIHEHYPRQTYRTRAAIVTDSGMINLVIPVSKKQHHTPVRDILLSYQEKWLTHHWHTLEAAYNSSPYFFFYQDELKKYWFQKPEHLTTFNHNLLKLIIKWLGFQTPVICSDNFIPASQAKKDFRNYFFPQKDQILVPSYSQVFSEKWGFIHNLSVIDLLFNLGPETHTYMKNLIKKLQHHS